ncbi:D-arabinono-1,4-lactone oxidase [Micromonospora sp. NPDC050397]|uniref:D-arabinono-1,4-lactone oxidase n=1 Tax=Micromonospora sp. NPDC050397 TaxID=3364279 RepID=UPI00384BF1A0
MTSPPPTGPTPAPATGAGTNWAGNITFGARRRHRPSSLAELRRIVAAGDRVRVLGTGHSFNHIADTPGDLVSVAGLPQRLEVDPVHHTVTVNAGIRYGELAARLHARGWALHNLGSLPHISVAGACATATHGSGVHNGNLATAVEAMELVTADGELVTVNRETDGDRFAGMVVNLDSLGVVTALTLRIEPTYDLRQYVYQNLPAERWHAHLDDILGGGYSVSLFTDWTGDTVDQVWRKCRTTDGEESPATADWYGATPADRPLHPVPGMSAVNCTEQLGVPGPWHVRLPHFRLEFTPSSGEELQSEYFVDRADALAALDALAGIREHIAPVLQISEIRAVAADDLWLSPSYRRDSVALHFTWVKDTTAVRPVLAAIEERLAPFAARPHWGKLHGVDPGVLAGRYERWSDFRRLRREYDPSGTFRNEWTDHYFPTGS